MNRVRAKNHVTRRIAAAMKRQLHAYFAESGDTEESLAEELGISKTYLNNLVNGHASVPFDIAVSFCRNTGATLVMEVGADLCGLTATPKSKGRCVEDAIITAAKEFGEALASVQDDCPETLQREFREAKQAIENLEHTALARVPVRARTLRELAG